MKRPDWMMTDKEMAKVKDFDLCSVVLNEDGDCKGCSVKCQKLATASQRKLWKWIEDNHFMGRSVVQQQLQRMDEAKDE